MKKVEMIAKNIKDRYTLYGLTVGYYFDKRNTCTYTKDGICIEYDQNANTSWIYKAIVKEIDDFIHLFGLQVEIVEVE